MHYTYTFFCLYITKLKYQTIMKQNYLTSVFQILVLITFCKMLTVKTSLDTRDYT
jgi:hypothetical protein